MKPHPRFVLSGTLLLVTVFVGGCFQQPTREELLEAQSARREQCDDMLQEIEDNKDRPLIRATLQENYNQTCVQNYPAPPG
ncbi:MAG: hypothetical protein AB8B96_13935 [Lysobacterales bacterium]